jgi:adenine-specific DNA-methyltransferase
MREITSYEHSDKDRPNNPPAGLVSPQSDPDGPARTYAYDPHLDPQLVWAGKAEHTSFAVPTVSLHVHERIDPRTILEAVGRSDGGPSSAAGGQWVQPSLFAAPPENPPLRQAIEFYRHRHGWSNRLIAGDSLLVMNSLLEKEGLGGQVQMIYIDPPYGIKYGSNFQPFVNKRDVKDGKDDDLTAEPEMLRAFRDTWELGIHSYLTYLRDRLLLARELLTDSGSCFVQISDVNIHHVRELMDEVFGLDNFIALIIFAKSGGTTAELISDPHDYLIWYGKRRAETKFRRLYEDKLGPTRELGPYSRVELPDGSRRTMSLEERMNPSALPNGARIYRIDNLTSQGYRQFTTVPFTFEGTSYHPGIDRNWKTTVDGLNNLVTARRLEATKGLYYVRFLNDFPVVPHNNNWADTGIAGFASDKRYVVETNPKVIQRCLLMTTDPGDLVLDPTCGSGTTAIVAEQWGRRWITCDTSRVAVTLAKQRLMTAAFDYYELAHPPEGVGSGFKYRTVPHITLKSIANNPDIREGMTRAEIDAAIARHAPQETLYDQPFVDKSKARVTGPFTVEAVPAPAVKPLAEEEKFSVSSFESGESAPLETKNSKPTTDPSIARTGETLRQAEWRDELFRSGIRGKAGQRIRFARLEPLPGTRYLHADGETKPDDAGAGTFRESGPEYATANNPLRVVVSFGQEHAPLDARQVEEALYEAERLRPKPKLLVFAAFQFDPEASKDIDATNWPGVTLLKAQMNPDLFTDDLKKKRSSNESFWLIGQPDVEVSSFEFLVLSESGERIADYGAFTELSGLDSLAEINRLGRQDLFLYALLSQGRDVWAYLANQAGWDFHTGEHRRGSGQKHAGGIPPVSWHSPRVAGGTGNIAGHLQEFGVSDRDGLRKIVERLRGSRAIAGGLEALAQTLNFPATQNSKLTTENFYLCSVHGFDYFNTKTGNIESGGSEQIAMWLLDPDYDGRSLFPRQVFFPMAGDKEGWARLARNLKAEVDDELIEAYRGTVSLPFKPGDHRRAAVKIIDDRGIESLKIVELD